MYKVKEIQMAKKSNKKELIEFRINQKLRLLENYENSIVYEFNNPIIRERYLYPIRQILLVGNILKEFWGFEVSTEEVKEYNRKVKDVIEYAKDIIDLANSLGRRYTEFRFSDLLDMRKVEKEKLVKNNRNIIEVFVLETKDSEYLYESVTLIDKYDLPIKQNNDFEAVERWLNKISQYEEKLKKIANYGILKIKDKIPLKKLGKYKAIRNQIKKLESEEKTEN
jgi:hypothetical protein